VHVDFTVAQRVGAALNVGESVEVFAAGDSSPNATPILAKIIAIDSRVDRATRNTRVRARIDQPDNAPAPGASVAVRIPVQARHMAVAVPVSALRKGPGGDHVFVIEPDKEGKTRAHVRQVESGAVLGDDIVIESGLSAGEKVAASGSFKLREAVPIAVKADALASVDVAGSR